MLFIDSVKLNLECHCWHHNIWAFLKSYQPAPGFPLANIAKASVCQAQVGGLLIRVAWDDSPLFLCAGGVGFVIVGVLIGSHRAICFCKMSIVVMGWNIESVFQGGVRTGEICGSVLAFGWAMELAEAPGRPRPRLRWRGTGRNVAGL